MNSQSMPRFASMLEQAFLVRGHQVQMWSPKARVHTFFPTGSLSKWAGYIDQYILFPNWIRQQLKMQSDDTLFVFTDQALGPWVPLVKRRPHIVHTHDLLALRSALGEIPENRTVWSGRIYQRYIRHGFQKARHFISVSNKTKDDLHLYGQVSPLTSEVVYNGLNYPFTPIIADEARRILHQAGLPVPESGMLMHLSGYQWYKNVPGIVILYAHYAKSQANPLPLWLVGPVLDEKLQMALDEVPEHAEVHFFHGLNIKILQAIYSLSRVFLFPSLAEGFGWPIIEAQACGCPVITTGEPPMNEVGGPAARYLPRLKVEDDVQLWAKNAAVVLNEVLNLEESECVDLIKQGMDWAKRFDTDTAIDNYLLIYQQVIEFEISKQL